MSTAAHLPGGDYLGDLRLDIPASFALQDEWLPTVPRVARNGSKRSNASRRFRHRVLTKLRLHEPLVNLGIERAWFEEFDNYWNAIGGRPLTVNDFHALRFHYRLRAQHTGAFDWGDTHAHLKNWQTPDNLYATFYYAYVNALFPNRLAMMPELLRSGGRALEFGCSLAPLYRTWRGFYDAIPTQWVLADIPNFPFHYARHSYASDAAVQLHTITDFADPLLGVEGQFDLIAVQEVFEHLDRPRTLAEYLVERLSPGGRLLFDYIRSPEVHGHDHPAGFSEREETLNYLAGALKLEHGDWHVDDRSLSTVVLRKPGA